MYKELFRIVDGVVQPVNEREATIREIRIILNRDKGSNGDSDGRKKKFAYKELGAVYWLGDFRSPGRMKGYEGKELIEDAIRNFELPENWVPDKTVNDLIKMYEAHVNGGVAGEVLTEIVSTFNLILQTVKKIRAKLQEKLLAPNITDAELKDSIALQNQLLTIAAEIPKKIKDIALAKEMLKRIESEEAEIGRGDVTITSSMRVDK